jgi:hypothetical protein
MDIEIKNPETFERVSPLLDEVERTLEVALFKKRQVYPQTPEAAGAKASVDPSLLNTPAPTQQGPTTVEAIKEQREQQTLIKKLSIQTDAVQTPKSSKKRRQKSRQVPQRPISSQPLPQQDQLNGATVRKKRRGKEMVTRGAIGGAIFGVLTGAASCGLSPEKAQHYMDPIIGLAIGIIVGIVIGTVLEQMKYNER